MDKRRKPVVIWLFTGALLVALMVVVGGITRLTQSGLSMVEWDLLMGSVPPLNESDWQEVFGMYKESPEFKVVNYDFTLHDFKSIFWWEYIHRMLGRVIGLVFIIPFATFLIQKRIDRSLFRKLIIIFLLGAFQGFLGWFMVKSGLVDVPHVSHYRLAAHLVTALALFGMILWVSMDLIYKDKQVTDHHAVPKIKRLALAGIILLGIQIVYGAFVAGLKAGLYYNTWPRMGNKWIPAEFLASISREGWISFVENITTVQVIHRYAGWILAVLVAVIFYFGRKLPMDSGLRIGSNLLLLLVLGQILLGILTLIYHVPVTLGVLHQLGALLLLGCFLFVLHRSGSS